MGDNNYHPPYSSAYASALSLAQFRDQTPALFWTTGQGLPGRPIDLNYTLLEPEIRARSFLDLLDWSSKSVVQVISLVNEDGYAEQVAGKIVNPSTPDGHREKREVQLLTEINHKHVVAVIGSFEVITKRPRPSIGILMYPLASQTLENLLAVVSIYNAGQARGPAWRPHVHVPRLLAYCACLCNALLYLHRRQYPIKHRDIKPSNILVDKDNNVILADFDISKVYDNVERAITIGKTEYTLQYAPGYVTSSQSQQTIRRGLEWDSISAGFVFLEMANVIFGRSTEEMIQYLTDSGSRTVVYSDALSRGKIEQWLRYLERIASDAPQEVPRELRTRAKRFLDAIRALMTCRTNDEGPLERAWQVFSGLNQPCPHCRSWYVKEHRTTKPETFTDNTTDAIFSDLWVSLCASLARQCFGCLEFIPGMLAIQKQ